MFLVHKKIKEKDRRRLSPRLKHYSTREYQRERGETFLPNSSYPLVIIISLFMHTH